MVRTRRLGHKTRTLAYTRASQNKMEFVYGTSFARAKKRITCLCYMFCIEKYVGSDVQSGSGLAFV